MKRGVSLIEMVVVIFIGVVIILSLLPVAIGLIRQQRALSAPMLEVESFPLIWERMRVDFAAASSASVEQPAPNVFLIVLSPQKRRDPEIVWQFQGSRAARQAEWTDEDGQVTTNTRRWTLPGPIDLDREQSTSARTVLRWTPPKGAEEFLAFQAGRATARVP